MYLHSSMQSLLCKNSLNNYFTFKKLKHQSPHVKRHKNIGSGGLGLKNRRWRRHTEYRLYRLSADYNARCMFIAACVQVRTTVQKTLMISMPLDVTKLNNTFNWIISYKINSDVQLMYGRIDLDPTVPKNNGKCKNNWWMQVVFRHP